MESLTFTKMHGIGNDFVVLDARDQSLPLNDAAVRAISDRHTGVGCDQLIVMERPRHQSAEVFMRIHNADGGEVEACGNATRCVATLLMAETGNSHTVVETVAGILPARRAVSGLVEVDMGPARIGWREIPVARELDTLAVPTGIGGLGDAVCTNMGNPHATFFVANAAAVDLAMLGPALEHHPLFPERANIGIVQILSPERLRLRVWERGVGITQACGSGACAALVAAARRGLTGRVGEVVLDGGSLGITWREDGHVLMSGPVAIAFSGWLDPSLLPPGT
ncbi:MAG TPA: diaminopimelate epimerase [Stellaceae bacterium]|nr:diaminopimelate epimerase [Stellaceae bacterium]